MIILRYEKYLFRVSDLFFNLSIYLNRFDLLNIDFQEWAFEQIKELHRRRFELQERALEIFLLNGKTFFMAFESTKVILEH